MPKIKAPRDPVLEMINGRIQTAEVPFSVLSDILGVKERQVYNKLKTPSAKWKYGDIQKMCRILGITSEELRERVSI